MYRVAFAVALLGFLEGCASEGLDVGHSSAQCAPAGVTESVVTEPDLIIQHVAVDDTHAYYLTEPPMLAAGSDGIPERVLKRVPLRGGATSELARLPIGQSESTIQEVGSDIALAGDWVYLSAELEDRTGRALYRVPKGGGSMERITTDEDRPIGKLVVDSEQNVYFTNREAIWSNEGSSRPRLVRIGLDGTRVVIVGPGDEFINGFTIDGDEVLWTTLLDGFIRTGGGTMSASRRDGSATRIVFANLATVRIDAVSPDEYFYTVYEATSAIGFYRSPKSGRSSSTVSQELAPAWPGRVVVAGSDLYWTTLSGPGEVVHKPSGRDTSIIASNQGEITDLRVSNCNVFWASSTDSNGSTLFRRGR